MEHCISEVSKSKKINNNILINIFIILWSYIKFKNLYCTKYKSIV